jgi:tetratricopeptide (TPR) repeat protein
LQQTLNLKLVFAALIIVCLTTSISELSTATLGTTIPQTNTANTTFAHENDIRELDLKGLVLHFLGKNNEAISFFDKALAINPNDVDVLTNKGISLHFLGKNNEAISFFDKALAINPNYKLALDNKRLALDALNKTK